LSNYFDLLFPRCEEVAIMHRSMAISDKFMVGNGTKQGCVLSPYLFTRHVRPLILAVAKHGRFICQRLAYTDDVVLLAPSWHAMQETIKILDHKNSLYDFQTQE